MFALIWQGRFLKYSIIMKKSHQVFDPRLTYDKKTGYSLNMQQKGSNWIVKLDSQNLGGKIELVKFEQHKSMFKSKNVVEGEGVG